MGVLWNFPQGPEFKFDLLKGYHKNQTVSAVLSKAIRNLQV